METLKSSDMQQDNELVDGTLIMDVTQNSGDTEPLAEPGDGNNVLHEKSLENINKNTTKTGNFPCDQPKCHQKFVNEVLLSKHKMGVHGIVLPGWSNDSSSFKCHLCGLVFNYYIKFKRHEVLQHHFPCDYCELRFPTAAQLNTHLKIKHSNIFNSIVMDEASFSAIVPPF